jgi:hypothetical protein
MASSSVGSCSVGGEQDEQSVVVGEGANAVGEASRLLDDQGYGFGAAVGRAAGV